MAVHEPPGTWPRTWRADPPVRDDGAVRITMDDGVGLEVEATGSGPGLLLVHGFGGAKEDFADHVEAFAHDHTVVVFDHRGHGGSDGPEDPAMYSFDRLVADTLAVADATGLSRFCLLGHSMGGMLARQVVLGSPERVDALILMDTAPGPVPSFDAELMDIAADIARTQGKVELKITLDAFAPLNNAAYERVLAERPGYQEFQDRKWDALSEVMWAVLVQEIARQRDDLPEFTTIACPALVIVGELDEPFLQPSHDMANAIPNATLVVVPDAGHSPQFENPDAWFAAVSEFLAARVAAGS
jgi:pimeloyl-ACP methyl ester carboxylesterase